MEKDMQNFSMPTIILNSKTFANDDRFMHVKLAICTHEQVANGMRFNRNLLESKMSQLDYLPVVGLVKVAEKSDGTCKYILGDHETELEIVDGELQYSSKTVILGTILPNTSRFEMITRHGETKEYVVAEALLYQGKYPQLKEVIKDTTDASMEIDNIEYEWNNDASCFDINDYRYTAHALIGVPPAFKLAGVLSNFSIDDFKQEYSTLLEEVKNFSLNIQQMQEEISKEGGVDVEDNKPEEVVEPVTEPEVEQPVNEEPSVEVNEEVEPTEPETEDIPEQVDYQALHTELQTAFNDLKVKYDDLTTQYNQLNDEVGGLREFKSNIEAQEQQAQLEMERQDKQAMIDSFTELTVEEKAKVIDNIDNFTVEEIESKLSVAFARKIKITKVDDVEETKTFANIETKTQPSHIDMLIATVERAKKNKR